MGLRVIISEELLGALLESARRKYPNEVFLLLGGKRVKNKVYITEIIYVPWREGRTHAILDLNHIPQGVIGSFHSHPGTPEPSLQDVQTFPLLGLVHIIAAYPFKRENVKAYDAEGREVEIEVGGQRASF